MTTNNIPEIKIDALLPQDMALKAETIGVNKAKAPTSQLLALSILAGAFIALGAIFATVVATGTAASMPYGITRLLMGIVFSLGLILVIIGGAELFTGNALIIMAWADKKITTLALLRNWLIVYIGNFLGSIGTAAFILLSKQYVFSKGEMGKMMLSIAVNKTQLGFLEAVVSGILCNALVCLAVWLTFSARSSTDKILCIIFPISAFVAAGFEHSVANMYFISIGLLIKMFDPAFAASTGLDLTNLTWGTFFIRNLLPVTIGNIIGGTVLVGAMYWGIYLKNRVIKQ